MWTAFRVSASLLIMFTAITGGLYPWLVTTIAQGLFPHEANGSFIVKDGKILGSELMGQTFSRPEYFWGRPSATLPTGYNATASGASNLGPQNPLLISRIQDRVDDLRSADPQIDIVPIDLVTASASGLDPHISPASATIQVSRVAKSRHLDAAAVQELVDRNTQGRFLGILGEPCVNVLALNIALDQLQHQAQ